MVTWTANEGIILILVGNEETGVFKGIDGRDDHLMDDVLDKIKALS